MPLFYVEFEKRIEVTVEAESLEAAREAAYEVGDWELDRDWDAEWDKNVRPAGSRETKFDMGVIDGEFLHPKDYAAALAKREAEKAAEAEKAPHVCDPNQMSLPLPEPPT